MSPRSCALLLLVLAGLHAPLVAEEPATPTPAERTAKLLAQLPKPDAGAGFSFAGEMLDQGDVLGSMSLSVEPAAAGSAGAWQAVDELRIGPNGEIVHVRLEALLDARLMGLEGKTFSKVEGEPSVTLAWKRAGAGYSFTRQEGDSPATSLRLESAEGRMPTLAALVFLALHMPAEGGPHPVEVLLVDANLGEDPAVRARTQTLTPLGVGSLEVAGVPTKLARVNLTLGDEPENDSILALSADRKALVQVNRTAGGVFLRLPPPEGPFDFGAPAKTARGAALKAARAFAVADLPAIEALLNWPTLDAKLAGNPELSSLEPALRRTRLLEGLKTDLERQAPGIPPETIEMVLRGLADSLLVEELGKGRARVTFPPLFRSMKLVVKKVGEVWLLDELPGNE